MKPGHRASLRRGTFPVALVCLVLQLASAAHFLVATHAVCPEHGEVVDTHPGAGQLATGAAERTDRVGITSAVGHEGLAEHEHEHCLAASERRDALGLAPQPQWVDPAGPRPDDVLHPEHERASTSVAVLRFAPKSSPPRRAAV